MQPKPPPPCSNTRRGFLQVFLRYWTHHKRPARRKRCNLTFNAPSALHLQRCVLPFPRKFQMEIPFRYDHFCTALTAGSSPVPSLPSCGAWSDSWAPRSPLPYHIAGPLSNWSYSTCGTFTLDELLYQIMVRNESNTAKTIGVGCRPCWRTKMSSAVWVSALDVDAFCDC